MREILTIEMLDLLELRGTSATVLCEESALPSQQSFKVNQVARSILHVLHKMFHFILFCFTLIGFAASENVKLGGLPKDVGGVLASTEQPTDLTGVNATVTIPTPDESSADCTAMIWLALGGVQDDNLYNGTVFEAGFNVTVMHGESPQVSWFWGFANGPPNNAKALQLLEFPASQGEEVLISLNIVSFYTGLEGYFNGTVYMENIKTKQVFTDHAWTMTSILSTPAMSHTAELLGARLGDNAKQAFQNGFDYTQLSGYSSQGKRSAPVQGSITADSLNKITWTLDSLL